ncbi:hemagglutinin repeat-containing protein [Vibrio brasiliensis]|uniref:hemagglutinin repeat-containing protein n=1 Tax=Vibrio brasiliensis TaxID=170652 RepID=UPI001EFE4092|nr:hemagglutinin repeat-containing protein [Vibrio brasiliensis]MCG9781937.1 hemagglutinin repeat-containing protein [Vibrio brasiliensis]
MDKKISKLNIWLTYSLCGVLTLQPALANVVIDSASGNTSKTQAGNGVEVVNIATPNSKGLSHNKYQQFNVDPSGLILNNSKAQLAQSQLGGILQNNPNLKGKAASVILNEVTGANRSQLEGYTEVFGQQANVILANPYGITCDGCGFINTPRVTLSTGLPEVTNGELTGFDVAEGSVTIEGLGLDATNQTYFDIISRTAEINANIHANDLSVITGNNKVSYQSNHVTEKASTSSSKPALAIDSSSLGGMYAGRISLVATEDGVGVNVGNLVSNVSDIMLTADGKVQLASAQSAKNIDITSSQEVALTNQQVAQEQLKISADNLVLNQTTVTAGDLVEFTVDKSVTAHDSQLFSGIKNNNQTNAAAVLNIKAAQLSLQDSEVISKGDLSGPVTSLALDSNSAVAASNIALTDVETIENDGEINANSTLDVGAEQLTFAGSGTMTADSIQIEVNSANLDSQMTAKTLSVESQSTLDIGQTANLQSTDTMTLNAEELTQKGRLTSNGTLTLDASRLTHEGAANAHQIVVGSESLEQRGQLIAEQDISITASNANLSGQTQARQSLQVTGDTINVTGTLEATQLDLTSISSINIDTPAQLSAINQFSVDTNDVSNRGRIHSGGGLTIGAHTLEQQGALTSVGDLQINTTSLDIQSDIETQGNLNLSASSVTNNAQVIAGQNLTLSAQSLSNNGTLTASGDTSVSLANNVTHGSSGMISGQNVTFSATDVDNSGTLQALDSLNLTVSSLLNKGGLVALGNLTATASNRIDNQSLIYAGNNANLYANTLHNTSDIVVGNDLLIAKNVAKQKSSSVTNSSGSIESLGGDIGIYTNNLTNKRTTLSVRSTSTIDKRASFTPVFVANGTAYQPEHHTTSYSKSNSRDHHNRTYYRHFIDSGRTFSAIAHKEGKQLVAASGASIVSARDNLFIDASNVVNNSSKIAGNNVSIKAGSLTNQGYTFSEYTTFYDYELRSTGSRYNSSWGDFIFDRTNTRKVKTGSSGQLNSSITASNNLTLNVANKVNNSTLKANATAVSPTKSAPELKTTSSASVTGPTITFANKNDIAFPEFAFPTAPNGLFVLSPDPKGKYLIETNPLLTNMGNFLGSDYFMSSVGFNPEADVKFLGDAFYDSRIISQAIFEQTGQQYLNDSIGSQLEQMQQLIDAAESQKSSLNLTAGIALSSAQIANLTQDILWYEEIEINGQKVLAPKLYLAQATIDNLSSGAQIAGSNVSIDAGDLANSGYLSADSTLSVNSANSITNIGGTIASSSDVSLTAEKDIINVSGDIKGHDVSLDATNGSIINETRVTTSTASLGNNRGSFTDVGKTAAITSTGNLTLSAGKNIENHAADINAGGDANLHAGQDTIISSKEQTHGYDVTARRWREGKNDTSQIASAVTVGGNLTMSAGQDIAVTASQVTSGESLSLAAGNDITVQTALNKQSDHNYRSNYTEINRTTQHQGSMLSGSNVAIRSGNNVNVSGSTVSASDSVDIAAKGDVNILAVNDSQYHYDKTVTKKSFGRSKTTINETYRETVKGSSISAGDRISIKAQNLDSVVTAGGDSDINIIGSALNADNEVTLSADGDVKLAAQTYKQFERHETIKKGFGGLSGRNQGSLDDATLLNSSYLINSGNTSITAGRDIGVIASEVTSGGEVNLNAVEDVLIAAGDVLKKSQQWDEKMSFLSGGNLFEMEKKRQGEETSTAQSSSIHSGGSLTVNAGSVKVVGSELNADHNVSLTADTGDVEILAAQETTKTFESEEKLSISLGDGLDGVSVEDGQIKISLGDASYDKVKQQSDALNHKESVVKAQNDLAVNAESSILVEGSTLASDSDGNHQGDLSLTAKDDVTIKEAVDTLSEQREEIHGKAEASLVVQHQAVEVAKAALALKEATKKLKQAKADFKQYKKGLDSLEATLATLEQEYKAKKPGVIYEDIEELQDLVSEVKSDEAWYVAGVALATENVASKTTLLVQQTAAAAQSTGTYGFNAGLHLDIEASKTQASSQQTTSVGSQLSGENVVVRAGNREGNQANISGSTLAANDNLEIAANEITITSSQDTQNSKSETQSGQIGASMTVYGASTGINLNASFDRNQSNSSSVTHNNSQLNADNIAITSNQDTNIKGVTVAANDSLTVDVGGDLNVASVQDCENVVVRAGNREGNQANISGSTLAANDNLEIAANEITITSSQDTQNSKSETQSGQIGASMTVYGASTGINLNASFDRNQSTSSSVTHNNSQLNADNITITSTQDTNIKGATVAANDSLTVDVGGNLNVASVQDRHSSSQKGMGISGGLSLSGGQTADGNGALPEGTLNSLKGAGNLTGASGGFNTSNGRTRTKQTVLTSLNSGGSADITVANNTNVKGALIATTDENGQDSGELNLTTGSLTFADLSNTSYNQNRSMGLNTSVGVNDGELDSTNNSTSVQYKNTSGYSKSKTLATIGQGQLTIADSENSDSTTSLNRDTEHTEKDLFTVDRKQGDIDVTVDHRLLTENGRKQIKEDVKRTELMGKSLADVALEDSVKLADTFEHMDVVQKELDVQLLIAQKKGDAAVNINNLENATAQQKQDAINDYAAAYSEVFGISIESALVIAVNKSIGGAHYTGDKGSNIVLNDKAMKNAQDYMNTLAHEVTHGLEKQGIIGDKGEQGENYAELIGGYAEGNYEFALENSGLGKVNKGNTNSHIGNDSKAVVDASEQFKTVQKSGTEIDYYLTQPEARRKAELTEFLLNCTDSSCRDTEEFKSKQKELVALNKKDEERDLAYKKACYSGGGDECNSESAKVVAAHDTWDKETAVKDSSLTSEYIDITSKNAEAEARPWELAAGSALAEMPTDALIGAISAVPEMVDLATTASAAMQGDEGAQQQLKTMYESVVETMSDPNGAADKYIADIQAKEASGEISSFEAKKQVSKFYISVAAAATGSAHGITKLGGTSLDVLEKAGNSARDIASRVDVTFEQGTLGSNLGNMKFELKPKANDAAEVVSDSTSIQNVELKPEGNFSKLDDPADTFRTPEAPEVLRADTDHPQNTGSYVLDPSNRGNKSVSNRQKYMGNTPSKNSTVGQSVQERMRSDGTLRGEGNEAEVLGSDGNWYSIKDTDMGHIESAVDYWNEKGRYFGPKSKEVREFMKDPENYILEPSKINRCNGAKCGKTYAPPASEEELKIRFDEDEL